MNLSWAPCVLSSGSYTYQDIDRSLQQISCDKVLHCSPANAAFFSFDLLYHRLYFGLQHWSLQNNGLHHQYNSAVILSLSIAIYNWDNKFSIRISLLCLFCVRCAGGASLPRCRMLNLLCSGIPSLQSGSGVRLCTYRDVFSPTEITLRRQILHS